MRLSTLIRVRLEHVRNERRTRAQIQTRQLQKFRRLARHAARHSPHYQEIVERRGIDLDRCVPQDFPVLTRRELVASFDRLVTDRTLTRDAIVDFLKRSKDPSELYQNRYHVVHTSGTSGEPAYIVYTPDEWTRGAAAALRMNPPALSKRRLAYFGVAGGHHAGATLAASPRRSLVRWAYEVAAYDLNDPIERTVAALNAFQPTILMGYTSALLMLAEQQLEGRLGVRPKQVQCSAEPLTKAISQRIERAFDVTPLNVYCSSEHLVMGVGRPEYGGMHLFEDDLIFELESDHTLVTNLFNHTLPLIRYRMDDMLVGADNGPSVLPFTRILDVVGRSEHTPVFTNEHGEDDIVSARQISCFHAKNLRRHQLEVIDKTHCTLRICLEEGVGPELRRRTVQDVDARFGKLLAQRGMANVRYRIEVVDDLPVDATTGKFRLIVPPEAEHAVAA